MENTPTAKKKRSIGLLPSMLIICISALVLCVMLTIILFSVFGNRVYARLKAGELRTQIRELASVSADFMCGKEEIDDLFLLTRATDATYVVLDAEGEEYIYHDPKSRDKHTDKPDRPEDMFGPNSGAFPDGQYYEGSAGDGGEGIDREPPLRPDDRVDEDPALSEKHREYIRFCKSVFPEVMQLESDDTEFRRYDTRLGVLVGMPVESDGQKLGAAYLIVPVNDLNEASKSVVLALVASALAAALIMALPIYLLTKWLIKPIKKMTGAALVLAEGDYSGRVDVAGSLEVRELGESFNTLADNLQDSIGTLVVERNRLRAVLDGLSEGIIGTESDASVVQHNAAALTLLGGREGDDIRSLPGYAPVEAAIDTVLSGGESEPISLTSGERTLRLSASAIHEENGDIAGSVALLMDVTEAERLEQTRRDYVANVSHELRTPLASIRGIADMLCDGLVKKEEDKLRYYGYIQRESIRLSTLINDLLELSRLQSGGVALEMRRVELYELVADVADRMNEPAANNGMSIRIDMPEGRYLARTNADRVEQVMVSLVDNAVKHGTRGGEIHIGIEEKADKWQLWVENPAELEQKDIEHLFERFYKADTAHTGEGTGLGLAITEEVLHLMGERIWIDSGDGVIRFTFTVQKEDSPKA